MAIVASGELIGKTVVSQDGADVGEVHGLDVDVDSWKVEALEIKLERDVLEKLNLKKPVFGTQTARLATERVAGVSDSVVLRSTLKEISFADSPESIARPDTEADEEW